MVGNDVDEMQKFVNDKVTGWKNALGLLAHEEIPTQLALLVGRWTMTAKPNMLARSLPPTITTQPLGEFGEAVVRTMEQRLKLSLTDEARTLFQLPLRKGGLGFCPPAETAPYAFLAGCATSSLAFTSSNISRMVKVGREKKMGGCSLKQQIVCVGTSHQEWIGLRRKHSRISRRSTCTSQTSIKQSAPTNYKQGWPLHIGAFKSQS